MEHEEIEIHLSKLKGNGNYPLFYFFTLKSKLMKSFHYSIPSTLEETKKLVETKCDLLIEAFNQLCKEEIKRIEDEKKSKKETRVWTYSIKTIENDWMILYKETTPETRLPESYSEWNDAWSTPFKIINGVLFKREYGFAGKKEYGTSERGSSISYTSADKLIPQGLADLSVIDANNKDW